MADYIISVLRLFPRSDFLITSQNQYANNWICNVFWPFAMAPIIDCLDVANGIYIPNSFSSKTLGSLFSLLINSLNTWFFVNFYVCAKMSSPKREISEVASPPACSTYYSNELFLSEHLSQCIIVFIYILAYLLFFFFFQSIARSAKFGTRYKVLIYSTSIRTC